VDPSQLRSRGHRAARHMSKPGHSVGRRLSPWAHGIVPGTRPANSRHCGFMTCGVPSRAVGPWRETCAAAPFWQRVCLSLRLQSRRRWERAVATRHPRIRPRTPRSPRRTRPHIRRTHRRIRRRVRTRRHTAPHRQHPGTIGRRIRPAPSATVKGVPRAVRRPSMSSSTRIHARRLARVTEPAPAM
jgi:hypothetical protein